MGGAQRLVMVRCVLISVSSILSDLILLLDPLQIYDLQSFETCYPCGIILTLFVVF